MILSLTDLKIIREFCKLKEGECCSSWKIMRKIYPKGRDVENTNIIQRIEKMSKYGFFLINYSDNRKKEYNLVSEKAIYKKFGFPNRKSHGIALMMEGKWNIIEL